MSTFPPVLSSLVCVLAPRGLWPFLVLRVPPYNFPFSRGMSADLYVVLGISTCL
ncbi:hypothetical protein BC629DRAFT_1575835 [Irpex lacteus]|nr:hypothetical protein BC629DRAFT_1575835 [Irpex lacteus]